MVAENKNNCDDNYCNDEDNYFIVMMMKMMMMMMMMGGEVQGAHLRSSFIRFVRLRKADRWIL